LRPVGQQGCFAKPSGRADDREAVDRPAVEISRGRAMNLSAGRGANSFVASRPGVGCTPPWIPLGERRCT
jgi:hypothetical protein